MLNSLLKVIRHVYAAQPVVEMIRNTIVYAIQPVIHTLSY